MMKLIIDRFEGKFAVCEIEDKSMVDIEISKLPSGVKEGDCLVMGDSGSISLDPNRTEDRKARIRRMMDRLKR